MKDKKVEELLQEARETIAKVQANLVKALKSEDIVFIKEKINKALDLMK